MANKCSLLELLQQNKEGDPDYVESCMTSLTALERRIICTLHHANEPIKISEIRNRLIEAEICNIGKNTELGKKIRNVTKKITGRHKMLAEIDRLLETDIPCFKTIETTLEQLEKDSIVLTKTTGSELSKHSWFLHPLIRILMINANKNLKREQNEKLFGKQPYRGF